MGSRFLPKLRLPSSIVQSFLVLSVFYLYLVLNIRFWACRGSVVEIIWNILGFGLFLNCGSWNPKKFDSHCLLNLEFMSYFCVMLTFSLYFSYSVLGWSRVETVWLSYVLGCFCYGFQNLCLLSCVCNEYILCYQVLAFCWGQHNWSLLVPDMGFGLVFEWVISNWSYLFHLCMDFNKISMLEKQFLARFR